MKQIIWKELRECFKWGLGLLAILSLAILVLRLVFNAHSSSYLSLFLHSPTYIILWGSLIIAALLGYQQARREKVPDQNAFLIHRPVSIPSVFWGKTLAGLFIFIAPTSLSYCFVTVLEIYFPAEPYPFQWSILIPGLLILYWGIPAYFAGFLAGIRESKWYGSRLFPLLSSSVVCGIVMYGGKTVSVIVGTHLLVTILLVVSSSNAFITANGQRPLRFGIGKWTTGVTIACSNVLLCFLAMMLLALFFASQQHKAKANQSTFAYQLLHDGNIYKMRYVRNSPVEAISLEENSLDSESDSLVRASDLRSQITHMHHVPMKNAMERGSTILSPFHYLEIIYRDDNSVVYYARQKGLITLYSRITKQLIGTLGPNGWETGGDLSRKGFQKNAHFMTGYYRPRANSGFFELDGKVWKFTLKTKNQEIESIELAPFTSKPPQGDLRAVKTLYLANQTNSTAPTILLATDQEILLITLDGNIILRMDISESTDRTNISIAQMTDLNRIAMRIDHWQTSTSPFSSQFKFFDKTTGALLNEISLPPINENPPQSLYESKGVHGIFLPPALGIMMSMMRSIIVDGQPVIEHRESNIMIYLCASALAAVILGICLCRFYNMSKPETAYWIVINALLSWAGPLTMLCLYKWPARTTCPTCNRQRSIHKDQCEHCEASFPEPELNGTEIFEVS